MLTEVTNVEQVKGEPSRRWFQDPDWDLFVWENNVGEIVGFQLCYDKGKNERALTWWRDSGYNHERVEDGEGRPFRYKGTPILMPDGVFDALDVAKKFSERCKRINQKVSTFVYQKLLTYPARDKDA